MAQITVDNNQPTSSWLMIEIKRTTWTTWFCCQWGDYLPKINISWVSSLVVIATAYEACSSAGHKLRSHRNRSKLIEFALELSRFRSDMNQRKGWFFQWRKLSNSFIIQVIFILELNEERNGWIWWMNKHEQTNESRIQLDPTKPN